MLVSQILSDHISLTLLMLFRRDGDRRCQRRGRISSLKDRRRRRGLLVWGRRGGRRNSGHRHSALLFKKGSTEHEEERKRGLFKIKITSTTSAESNNSSLYLSPTGRFTPFYPRSLPAMTLKDFASEWNLRRR